MTVCPGEYVHTDWGRKIKHYNQLTLAAQSIMESIRHQKKAETSLVLKLFTCALQYT